ncbi:MAG: lipoprotein-releasing ABC transporter ATP-binding protein LolD [Legionella sp.]|nr:lipoprotein-releasing ABC transporter ATP-binding protein LolD [Legionella sp.]
MNDLILSCQNLSKSFNDGTSVIHVLQGIDLSIAKGTSLAIIGPSGSGKSTLLHLLGGLDTPTKGNVYINQVDWTKLKEKKRCLLRNKSLGFVYQFHHLLPEFTALENVAMPLLLGNTAVKKAVGLASDMLDKVGLKARKEHKPAQLSGGERQRVAIARALVHQPHCLLADEPTGNLDQATAKIVLDLMLELNNEMNTALVIVTHDQQIAQRMDKILLLKEGCLSVLN